MTNLVVRQSVCLV